MRESCGHLGLIQINRVFSGSEVSKWNGFKRKQLIPDVNLLKKPKIQDASSGYVLLSKLNFLDSLELVVQYH